MNRFFFLILLSTAFPFTLRAEDAPSPFALPSNDPLTVLSLPDGLDYEKVSVAVSKALVDEQWENLNWERNVTIATTTQSRVSIKVFALASATEVKLYASYTAEKSTSEEKCKKVTLRQLRYLEKSIAAKLSLIFRQAKGEDITDKATVE